MIPLNELRVGNYWNHKSGLYKISSPCEISDASKLGDPIELTPEVLKKCGFKVDNDIDRGGTGERFYRNRITLRFSDGKCCLWVNIDDDTWYSFAWTEVVYLHQLQNLQFFLTSTELDYKP